MSEGTCAESREHVTHNESGKETQIAISLYNTLKDNTPGSIQAALSDIPLARNIRNTGVEVLDPDSTGTKLTASPFNGSNKFTENCHRCLAIIISGQADTKPPVSALIHASPKAFDIFQAGNNAFNQFFSGEDIQRFIAETNPASRQVLIVGGMSSIGSNEPMENKIAEINYRMYLGVAQKIITENLGINPTVLYPKDRGGFTHVYYNSALQQAVVLQTPQKADGVKTFRPSDDTSPFPKIV